MTNEQGNSEDPPSEREEALLAELRRALGHDAAPEGLVERAAGLVAFADVDRELDELLREVSTETAGVRGPGDDNRPRLFEIGDGTVACELAIHPHRLDGQMLSGNVASVALVRLAGPGAFVPVDDLGQFSFQHVPPGPARLRLDDGSARDLVTDWFVV